MRQVMPRYPVYAEDPDASGVEDDEEQGVGPDEKDQWWKEPEE
jgi:hypothetical protein